MERKGTAKRLCGLVLATLCAAGGVGADPEKPPTPAQLVVMGTFKPLRACKFIHGTKGVVTKYEFKFDPLASINTQNPPNKEATLAILCDTGGGISFLITDTNNPKNGTTNFLLKAMKEDTKTSGHFTIGSKGWKANNVSVNLMDTQSGDALKDETPLIAGREYSFGQMITNQEKMSPLPDITNFSGKLKVTLIDLPKDGKGKEIKGEFEGEATVTLKYT